MSAEDFAWTLIGSGAPSSPQYAIRVLRTMISPEVRSMPASARAAQQSSPSHDRGIT